MWLGLLISILGVVLSPLFLNPYGLVLWVPVLLIFLGEVLKPRAKIGISKLGIEQVLVGDVPYHRVVGYVTSEAEPVVSNLRGWVEVKKDGRPVKPWKVETRERGGQESVEAQVEEQESKVEASWLAAGSVRRDWERLRKGDDALQIVAPLTQAGSFFGLIGDKELEFFETRRLYRFESGRAYLVQVWVTGEDPNGNTVERFQATKIVASE